MSTTFKNSKVEIYAELEALRIELAAKVEIYTELQALRIELSQERAKNATPEVAKVVTPQPEVKRDKTVFIAAAKAQRAEYELARIAFIKDWCATNNATSVPGEVVAAWANARR